MSIKLKEDEIESTNSIEKEIPFQHTQEGRLRAMCLWSPAEPRLLNQSAGCDRLTGREIERVVCMCVCVCVC